MKTLLIAEMKRALELFELIEEAEIKYKKEVEEQEKFEKENDGFNPYNYHYVENHKWKYQAELKQIMLMVRKHSVELEKQMKSRWG